MKHSHNRFMPFNSIQRHVQTLWASLPYILTTGCLAVGFVQGVSAQNLEQQSDSPPPVNLLQLGPVDNAGDTAANTPDNGDNALGASISGPSAAQVLAEQPITPRLDKVEENLASDSQQSTAISPDNGSVSPIGSRQNRRADLPAISIERRAVSKVSLASVGLKRPASLSPELNALIWSKSDAKTALNLMENAPALGSSPILNRLVFEIMAIAAVPPKGAGPMAEDMVSARLNWLAAAGQSDALAEIVRMLPEDDRWANWKRWQVEYDLIRRADDTACRDAETNAQATLDNFWHQSRIICALLNGDKGTARFAADILQASGSDDQNFFQLVDKLLGRSDSLSIDLTEVDSVDLVLMDVAHEQISLAAFEQMPASMIQAASSFRYLAADAALKTSFMMLERGLQDQQKTEQIWRALLTAPMPAEAALATLNGLNAQGLTAARHDELASALLWVSLSMRDQKDTDQLVRRAIETEVASGRPELLLDLYASLIRQRLDNMQEDLLSSDLKSDYALILSLSSPNRPLPEILADYQAYSADIKGLMASLKGEAWQADSLDRVDGWSLLPLLSVQKAGAPEKDWTKILQGKNGSIQPIKAYTAYYRLPAAHLMALKQLATEGQIAETGMLASILIQPYALDWIEPADLAVVVDSLNKVGLQNIASQLAEDALKAHLLRHHFSRAS